MQRHQKEAAKDRARDILAKELANQYKRMTWLEVKGPGVSCPKYWQNGQVRMSLPEAAKVPDKQGTVGVKTCLNSKGPRLTAASQNGRIRVTKQSCLNNSHSLRAAGSLVGRDQRATLQAPGSKGFLTAQSFQTKATSSTSAA